MDLYIRNQGTELQITPADIPHIQELLKRHPNPTRPKELIADHPTGTNVAVVEASVGAFALGYPPYYKNGWALWNSAWGSFGLFYAWEATLRYADGVARVNLLLNRASPWMDVDSHLPYEGKVVLRNKTAREVFVRIPLYVDKKRVESRLGPRTVRPEWFGSYLHFRGLKNGDVITIEFPLEERTEQWTASPKAPSEWYGAALPAGTVCTFRFKGNTLIETTPPLMPGSWLYLDRARKFKASSTPMKRLERFVTPFVLRW